MLVTILYLASLPATPARAARKLSLSAPGPSARKMRENRSTEIFHLAITRSGDHISTRGKDTSCLQTQRTYLGIACVAKQGRLVTSAKQRRLHRIQRITGSVFRISFHPDWQIDNGIFNRPIMACSQIRVHRQGPKTRISALHRIRRSNIDYNLQLLPKTELLIYLQLDRIVVRFLRDSVYNI